MRSSHRLHQTAQRRGYPSYLDLEVVLLLLAHVTEPLCDVKAVADLAKRCQSDLQKVQTIRPAMAAETFNDINWHRKRRPAKLFGQFELLDSRKLLGDTVKADEEIIRALPGDERVMRQRHGPRASQLLYPAP